MQSRANHSDGTENWKDKIWLVFYKDYFTWSMRMGLQGVGKSLGPGDLGYFCSFS